MSATRHAFLVSAAHKSSGKTTVSIGLCAALTARGKVVQPFKKGPDYIDPMWLGQAAGRPCRNLDLYLSELESLRTVWQRHAAGAEVCLVEGNKGLYDGLALDGSNSNAALAVGLDLPVILVIDCRGMTRGIAPLVLGYQAFDPAVKIAGVILNRVGGKRHEGKLREVLERYTSVPVVGAIPETPELAILERHLGLMPSNEASDPAARIDALGKIIAQHVDIDRLLALCPVQPVAPGNVTPIRSAIQPIQRPAQPAQSKAMKIGIARDRAFGFYYPEDLEALTAAGAELVSIDTLRDAELPELDALFIGGGFPETLAATLEANQSLRSSIRCAIESGLPTYAECGGLMYLSRSITWQGRRYEMVGAIPADTVMRPKPVGRGYVNVEATAMHPWWPAGTALRAHEFHYSRLENLDPALPMGWNVQRGYGINGTQDGLCVNNLFAAYTHLRTLPERPGKTNPGNPATQWASAFVAYARKIGWRTLQTKNALGRA